MKQKAIWIKCEHEAGPYADHCTNCAPWWEEYATCPRHRLKLYKTGWCRACHKFYDLKKDIKGKNIILEDIARIVEDLHYLRYYDRDDPRFKDTKKNIIEMVKKL